jgi:eukaryotic-like serine/threonine-protein kinase
MKLCPNCKTQYQDDANFCPQESCASDQGPRRLEPIVAAPPSRYQLESQLGGARTGEVWRARDTQSGAAVAYKLVAQASLPTNTTLERAQRELKQLQRAQSNRLARVLDFGKDPGGRLFIASELCEGQPLDRLVAATGPLSLDRAKAIVAQIGEALLEGQKVGVVHHDLSPKNVLIGGNDEVKVINFVAPLAVSDTIFGVPEYLAPEQAEGKLVDQRSNTYSLGGIMVLLLSGQPPVSGADTAAILDQVLKGEVVPPSRRLDGASTLTPEIDRVVLKAMDKSPNRRPLTMRQFLTEVSGMVAAGAAPAAATGAGVGFAKTMLFSGGSPEVQKLVQQAVAARGGATAAAPAPAAAATPAPAATPPVEYAAPPATADMGGGAGVGASTGPRRTHGAAIAATVVSLPAAKIPGLGAPIPGGSGQFTPPPVSATPAPVAATPPPQGVGPAPTPKPAAGGNFRETLWFKKGDVDQMVADARARVEAARAKGVAVSEADAEAAAGAVVPPVAEEGAKPLDEAYVDDGSLTADDRKKFSLRSGATSTALPTVGGAVPGERMSDAEVMGEIGGKKKIIILVIAAVVLVLLGIVVVKKLTAKDVAKNAAALTPTTIPTTEPAPPPAAPPTPPPAAAAKPAAAAADDGDEPAAKPAHAPASAKKQHAAKKAKGKKAHK